MENFGLTFNDYHSYTEIQEFMNRIVWTLPGRAKLHTIGRSVEGREIQGIHVILKFFKKNFKFGNPKDLRRKIVFLDGGMHVNISNF